MPQYTIKESREMIMQFKREFTPEVHESGITQSQENGYKLLFMFMYLGLIKCKDYQKRQVHLCCKHLYNLLFTLIPVRICLSNAYKQDSSHQGLQCLLIKAHKLFTKINLQKQIISEPYQGNHHDTFLSLATAKPWCTHHVLQASQQ